MFAFEDPAAAGLNLILQQSVVTERYPPSWGVLGYLECILAAFGAQAIGANQGNHLLCLPRR